MSEVTLKKSDVFISYGRKESKYFASRINKILTDAGYDVWFDQNDIPLAIDFQDQIDDGIRKANNFIFIIAPHALRSPYCLKEIQLAVKLNKRIIPILHIEPKERTVWEMMHPTISKLNWIYFRQTAEHDKPIEQWKDIDDFEKTARSLIDLLKIHSVYVNTHTDLLIRAIEWDRNRREHTYLLIDKERREAEKWLTKIFENTLPPCNPTFIHCEYICESKKFANNMMTDVYFCYTPELDAIHNKIRNSLMRYGITSWTAESSIRSSQKYKSALRTGIEQADNFIFFVAPQTVNSFAILEEFDIAVKYRKRIIPILVKDTDENDLPPRLSTMNKLDFRSNNKNDFIKGFGNLLFQLKDKSEYYFKHKILLTKALKWKQQKQNPSILLRGFNLEHAKTWLKLGLNYPHKPTPLHKEFIRNSADKVGQLHSDVFISYSRSDCDFAHRMNDNLQVNGKTTWFDQESIAATSEFQKEIFKGIDDSDNFIFIITPDSIASTYCVSEVEYAVEANKRIIPVLYRKTNLENIPDGLKKRQWINFLNTTFEIAYSELIRNIDTDREYVHRHTNLLLKAKEWDEKQKINPDDTSLLLRGTEYLLAENWQNEAIAKAKKPSPSSLIISFLNESKNLIEQQKKKEEERQNELLRLQQARTEEAEKNLTLQKNNSLRQRQWIVAMSFALIFSIIAAVGAVIYWLKAKENAAVATERQQLAEEMTNEAERLTNLLKKQIDELDEQKKLTDLRTGEKEKLLEERTRHEEKYHEALDKINEFENEQTKIENSDIEDDEKERMLKEYRNKIKKQEAITLAHYAHLTLPQNAKLSFKLGELAYRKDKTNPDAYGAYLDAFYKLMSPKVIFPKHAERIISANFSSDRSMIVTASWDKTSRICTPEGKTLVVLRGHEGVVNYAAFSPNGERVITASNDKTVRIWDLQGNELKALRLHEDVVNTAVFSPNGQNILSASSDKTIKIHDLSGKQIWKQNLGKRVNSAHYSSNGNKIITADDGGRVRIYDLANDKRWNFNIQKDVVSSACFSPDGKYVLTGSWDKKIRLYDLNKKLIASFDEADRKITSVTFSADQNYIIASHHSETVLILPIDINIVSSFFKKSFNYVISPKDKEKYNIQ